MAPTRVILMSCGSYNPPTNMHLRMFEIARDHLHRMGTHIVVGAVISPTHDDYAKKELTNSEHRCAMLKLATQNSDWIKVSTWETRQNGWTKTRSSLQHHQNMLNSVLLDSNDIKYHCETEDTDWIPENIKNSSDRTPIQIKLLCGADLLESFGTPGLWADEDIDAIVGQHGLVVVTREGSNPNKFIYDSDILSKYMHNIHIVTEWIPNEVSSTKIRRALKRGESVRYLLQDSVIEYIYKHGIYEAKTVSTIKLELSSKNDNDYLSIQPKYESTFLTPSPSDVTMTTPSPIEIISIDLSESVIKKNYHNSPIKSRTNFSEIPDDNDDMREKFNNVMTENVNKILGSNKIIYPGQAKQIIANESGESQIFCEVGLNSVSENCKVETEIDGKVGLVAIKNDNLSDCTSNTGESESEDKIVVFNDKSPIIDSTKASKSMEQTSSIPDDSVIIPINIIETSNIDEVQESSKHELPPARIDREDSNEESPRVRNRIGANEMIMVNLDEESSSSNNERDEISQADKDETLENIQDTSIPKAIELDENPNISNDEIVINLIEEKISLFEEIGASKEKSIVAINDRDLSDQDTTTEESAPKLDSNNEIDGKYLKSVVNSRKSPKKIKNDKVLTISSEMAESSEVNIEEKSHSHIDIDMSLSFVEAVEDTDLTRKEEKTSGRKRGVVFQGSLDSINVKQPQSSSMINSNNHPPITKKSKSYEFIKPTDVQPTTIYKIPLKDENPSSRCGDSPKIKTDGNSISEVANGKQESGQNDEFCSVCCYANEPSTTEAFYTLGSAGSSPLVEASSECDICSNCDSREDPEQKETSKFAKPVRPGEPVCELCEICGDVAMDEDVVASSRPEKDDFVDRRLSASRPLPLSLPKKKKSVVRLNARKFSNIDNDDVEDDDEDDMDHFEIETSGICRKIIDNRDKKPMFKGKSIEQNSTDDTNSNDDEFEIENCGLDTDVERDIANDEDSRYKNEVEDTLRNIIPRDEIAMSTKNSKKKMTRAGSLINRDTIDRTRAKRRYSSVDNLPNSRQTVKLTTDKQNSLRSRGIVKGLVASADNIRPVRNSRSRTILRKSADDVTRDYHSSMDDTRESPLYENLCRTKLSAKEEQPNKPRDSGTIKMILTKHGIKIISDKETAL